MHNLYQTRAKAIIFKSVWVITICIVVSLYFENLKINSPGALNTLSKYTVA